MPEGQATQPVPDRGLHHGRGPFREAVPERFVGGHGDDGLGRDGAGEQRYGREQVPIRLSQPIGVELQHLADASVGARRGVEFGAQRLEVCRRWMVREQPSQHARG